MRKLSSFIFISCCFLIFIISCTKQEILKITPDQKKVTTRKAPIQDNPQTSVIRTKDQYYCWTTDGQEGIKCRYSSGNTCQTITGCVPVGYLYPGKSPEELRAILDLLPRDKN